MPFIDKKPGAPAVLFTASAVLLIYLPLPCQLRSSIAKWAVHRQRLLMLNFVPLATVRRRPPNDVAAEDTPFSSLLANLTPTPFVPSWD